MINRKNLIFLKKIIIAASSVVPFALFLNNILEEMIREGTGKN
jgi:hypothetical protein